MKSGKLKLYIQLPQLACEYKSYEVDYYRAYWKNLKDDKRKSWRYYTIVSRPCGHFENGIVRIYKTRNKNVFAMVSYYDGSFYPLIMYTHLSADIIKAIDDLQAWRKHKENNIKG